MITGGGGERIDIHLTPRAAGGHGVRIVSHRSTGASRVLEGRAPREAVPLVPLLFALCGRSQQIAALRAVEAATGIRPAPREEAARALVVAAETVSEHATRMLVDWPRLVGEVPAMGIARQVREAAAALQVALFPRGIPAGCSPDAVDAAAAALAEAVAVLPDVLAQAVEAQGLCDLGEVTAPLMPACLDPHRLAARMAEDDAFVVAPEWDGLVFETGPFARLHDHPEVRRQGWGLAARLAARAVETAETARKIVGDAAALCDTSPCAEEDTPPGAGLGVVEAGRGRLAHYVALQDGRVTRWRILAPTEWNFHPRGPLAEALGGLPPGPATATQRAAQWLVAALDPCVACTVTVGERADA